MDNTPGSVILVRDFLMEETIASKMIRILGIKLDQLDRKNAKRRANYIKRRMDPLFVEKQRKAGMDFSKSPKGRSSIKEVKKSWFDRMSPERRLEYNKQQCKWRASSYERLKTIPERRAKLRARNNNYVKFKRKTDPLFLLKMRLRDQFRSCIRRGWITKNDTALNLCGCTIEYLKCHIESQFKEGMSWDNYGNGKDKWNIDHITPLAAFDLSDTEQQKTAFHYTNLQPLWYLDNCIKNSVVNGVRQYYSKHEIA